MSINVNDYVFYKRQTSSLNYKKVYMLLPAKVTKLYKNNRVMLELNIDGKTLTKLVKTKSLKKVNHSK